MEFLSDLLDGSLMPHGHCLLWRTDLLVMYIGGDSLIVLAYFIIPSALIYLVHKRDDLEFNWVFLLFASFIYLCGITHAINILNIWNGYYSLAGLFKLTTGIVSITTAFMIWKLIPQALAIPSNKMLLEQNAKLSIAEEQLREANRQLERRVKERTAELEALASTDSLTGIYNRRKIMECLENEAERCLRYSNVSSILMIDLDDFKKINDQHGHQTGDKVLVEASQTFKQLCRKTDSIGRYGGEEFLILLPDTPQAQAVTLACRICEEIQHLQLQTQDNHYIKASCSIGIASLDQQQNSEELLQKADAALYQAKQSGKNTVVTATN